MTDWLSPDEWRAVALSLRVSFWATVVSLPFGVLAAYALARWNFWGRTALNGLVHLPLILPPVVTGYLLLHQLRAEGVTSGSGWISGSASCWPSAGLGRCWRRR